MCQIVVIHRNCNGLHGGFQFVLGQVTLPNDEHLSAISFYHSVPLHDQDLHCKKIQAEYEVPPKRYKLMKNNAEKIQANGEVVLKRYRLMCNLDEKIQANE